MDLGSKNLKANTLTQSGRSTVLGQGLDKDQQRTDGVVAGQQGQENFPQAKAEACTKYGAGFLQTGRNVQHGILQHGQHKWEHMQAHDQHQTCQGEEPLLTALHGRDQLLQKATLLHEQDPAHGCNIGRSHKGDHEDNVECLVMGKLGSGEDIGQRECDDGGNDHHQQTQQKRVADHDRIFTLSQRLPHRIEVKAAICHDRLGKNRNEGADDQKTKKHRQQKQRKILFLFHRLFHRFPPNQPQSSFILAADSAEISRTFSQSQSIWGMSARLVRLSQVMSARPGSR